MDGVKALPNQFLYPPSSRRVGGRQLGCISQRVAKYLHGPLCVRGVEYYLAAPSETLRYVMDGKAFSSEEFGSGVGIQNGDGSKLCASPMTGAPSFAECGRKERVQDAVFPRLRTPSNALH